MSKTAAATFINEVKKTRAKYDELTSNFYKKHIVKKEKPTDADLKAMQDVIAKMQALEKAYHGDVKQALQGFGGPSDTTISSARTLYTTMQKMSKAG